MMMARIPFVISIAAICITIFPAFAQQPAARSSRRSNQSAALILERSPARQAGSLRVRSLGREASADQQPQAATPPPAPGVVQVHVSHGNVFAAFIATSAIPHGTPFGGSVSSDNGSQIDFDNVTFNSDMIPGDYVQLPQFSNVGDLFPQGTITYTVKVTVNKQATQANGVFFLASPPIYSDLQSLTPVLYTTAQSIASNNDMMLAIKGLFTTETPLIVLGSSDLGNFAVPASAIKSVTASEIGIDLSQVPGLDLSALNEYLLTVSQAGYADTVVYRYVPAQPKTFNPAPQ